jgi:signal recognition particle GTPase
VLLWFTIYHGIPIKIVTYINKRKLFMANVVTKLDGDVRWGAILGVLQTDGDKFRIGLSRKLKKSLKKEARCV